MDCSRLGFSVHHQLPESTQTHVHRVGDAIQPSHPLSSPSPPAPNPSQHSSNFLEEICSLSHSIVFLYFFALITEEVFLVYPCYSLELCSAFKWVYLSFYPLPFASLLFTAVCKASSDNHVAFLHFFFLGTVLFPISCTMSQTPIHYSSGTLSIRSNPLNLFVTSIV